MNYGGEKLDEMWRVEMRGVDKLTCKMEACEREEGKLTLKV